MKNRVAGGLPLEDKPSLLHLSQYAQFLRKSTAVQAAKRCFPHEMRAREEKYMRPTVTSFSNAVYHRPDRYHLPATIFSRLELKVLLMVNGRRSVTYIARLLGTNSTALKPVFARLVKLSLIQTEDTLVSTDEADLFLEKKEEAPSDPPVLRHPLQFA